MYYIPATSLNVAMICVCVENVAKTGHCYSTILAVSIYPSKKGYKGFTIRYCF